MAVVAVKAENKQTVSIGGETTDKTVSRLTFVDSLVTLVFTDGTQQTADMESVSIDLSYDDDASGVSEIKTDGRNADRVYSIGGQYLGNSVDKLRKGIYIVGGKKLIIK